MLEQGEENFKVHDTALDSFATGDPAHNLLFFAINLVVKELILYLVSILEPLKLARLRCR